jgi:hypothetical protein
VARGDIDDSTLARHSLPLLFRSEGGQQSFFSTLLRRIVALSLSETGANYFVTQSELNLF